MEVKHSIEKEDGSVVFQGKLEGQELSFVIEMGLETLIRAGAIPFASTEDRTLADIHEPPEGVQ